MSTIITAGNEYVYLSDYIYLVLGMFRPQSLTFLTRLEHEHFPPGSPLNDKFTVHMAYYGGNPYSIIGVPMENLKLCRILAESLELQLINGLPLWCSESKGETVNHFPISHSPDLTWTVQNKKTMDPRKITSMLQREVISVQKYISKFYSETAGTA